MFKRENLILPAIPLKKLKGMAGLLMLKINFLKARQERGGDKKK